MANYITIDGGTTNTRLRLIKDGELFCEERIKMGAKDYVVGSSRYNELVRDSIGELLIKGDCDEREVRAIIASGMLTSEAGLCNVPHVEAPVGARELCLKMVEADVGISSIPCYFIPGVKISSEDVTRCDIMRGEECEFVGLEHLMKPSSVCILPGSHTKHVFSDEENRISDFTTYLTGEMISAISGNTILNSSVDIGISDFDEEALLLGYDSSVKMGVNRALFKARILDKILGKSKKEIYSYFLGVILSEDVGALKECKRAVYVGGKRQLRESILCILKNRTELEAYGISDEQSELASAIGAIKVFERRFNK